MRRHVDGPPVTAPALDFPNLPSRMRKLPRNDAGYPVPWFVGYIDGKPDFRVIGEGKIVTAVRHKVCWLCGDPLGKFMAFVIGPMCAVNRVSSEPPSHRDCAVFAATNCPFLANPARQRRENNLPEERKDPAGVAIARNPGVALVWVTLGYERFQVPGGFLFDVGEPFDLLWFAHGRTATRAEILASLESGIPILQKEAEAQSPEAVAALAEQYQTALRLVPA